MVDIIIDIETLGTMPERPIIEIGACAINRKTGAISACFSRRIRSAWNNVDELVSYCEAFGERDFAATVEWWASDPGRRGTLEAIIGHGAGQGGMTLRRALLQFGEWVCKTEPDRDRDRIWSNGPAFDIAFLRHAYDFENIPLPWAYWQERCVRTALEMANYERGSLGWIERGPRHRALNDARHEARKLYFSGALGEVSSIMLRLRQRYDVKANA